MAAVLGSAYGQTPHRAAWLQEARWGVMTHYLPDWIEPGRRWTSAEWNQLVEGFDVEGLARQLQAVGAGYYLISIGQNSGFYIAPNPTYDRLVGVTPSRCARRDLVADLHAALQPRGIRLLVYLPSGAPNQDGEARRALEWTNGPHPNAAFRARWEEVVRDWSRRWRTKVSGWWFDGCSWPNHMDGVQIHVLTYLGESWGRGAPRLSPERAVAVTREVIQNRGAVTWDVPVQRNGVIAEPFLAHLRALHGERRGGPGTPR